MQEFLYHALGICGEHWHPNLINLSAIGLVVFYAVKVIRRKICTT
jgi:hypothetical protein